LVETGLVVEARYGQAGGRLDLLVAKAGLAVESVTPEQAEIARVKRGGATARIAIPRR
jgi:hypothetical protein